MVILLLPLSVSFISVSALTLRGSSAVADLTPLTLISAVPATFAKSVRV